MDFADDLERGLVEGSNTPAALRDSNAEEYSISNALSKKPLNLKDDLEIFQTLVGISFLAKGGGPKPEGATTAKPASPLADIFRPSKASASRFRNRGLYDRALSQELKNRVLYTMSHYIITSLYLLQIFVAATFTALSAFQFSPHQNSSTIALTILGAFNTVVAGILAWLRGQGMPTRFRRARDQFRECVKQIEAAERMFAEVDFIRWNPEDRPDPIQERDRLEKMFDDAQLDEQANYPESVHNPAAAQQVIKNQELEDKIGKNKVQKNETRNEIETLKRELEGYRGSARQSVRIQ